MLYEQIKWFFSRPDVKRNLIKASFKRLFWRLYWLVTSQPFIVPLGEKLKISIDLHHSVGIGIVGHYSCAGNPAPKDEQIRHIKQAIKFLRKHHENTVIIGLWVNEKWED